jgi:hypothetical protein
MVIQHSRQILRRRQGSRQIHAEFHFRFVSLEGESGADEELVARQIHESLAG